MVHALFVVSACLAGKACRYDAGSNPCPQVMELVAQGKALPLCPEVLGGLPCPRPPCENVKGRIMDRQGNDHSAAFVRGATEALAQARAFGASAAILKSRSPSCGFGQIYDGTFSKSLTQGHGLWANLLQQEGISLYSEENLPNHEPPDQEPLK